MTYQGIELGYGLDLYKDVKLGYGWDFETKHIVKFDCTPQNVKKFDETNEKTECFHHPYFTESTFIQPIGQYIRDLPIQMHEFFSIPKVRFHKINFGYNMFALTVSNRTVTCESCDKYPKNTEYYVSKLNYGIDLRVMMSLSIYNVLLWDIWKSLLEKAVKDVDVLTNEQKKIKCHVMINHSIIKEMTLEEVFKFKNEYLEGKHREFEQIVNIGWSKHQWLTPIRIENTKDLSRMLFQFHRFYCTVECQMEQSGYPFHNVGLMDASTDYKTVKDRLSRAITSYDESESYDVIEIYSIIKNLYWSYCDVIKYSIENRLDIDLDFPKTNDGLSRYLLRINSQPVERLDPKKCSTCSGEITFNEDYRMCKCGKKKHRIALTMNNQMQKYDTNVFRSFSKLPLIFMMTFFLSIKGVFFLLNLLL